MTPTERPVLFAQLLDDYLRRRDLKARDEDERQRRRLKEHARLEFLRARFGTHPLLAITTRDVETIYEDLKGRTVGQGEEKRLVATATVNRFRVWSSQSASSTRSPAFRASPFSQPASTAVAVALVGECYHPVV
jgi:hypothetical protein